MTNIDQFESVFNAAAKPAFVLEDVSVRRVLVVTDLPPAQADEFEQKVRAFLSVLGTGKGGQDCTWDVLSDADYDDVDGLLTQVQERKPDLVCSYRNLKTQDYQWPYSLGVMLNVLTRQLSPPVLVLPHPKLDARYAWAEINTDRVMVVTDHLAGDARLVNWGLRFCEPEGKLILTHIEDDEAFDHYIDIISKIPSIATHQAETAIRDRLLKEPADYIASCQQVIKDAGIPITVEPVVEMGHQANDYRRLVEAHEADLLIFRTRDADNTEMLALDGAAYALALELRSVPLLML